MKKNLNKFQVPIIYSNKLLLHQVKTQLLKVINYYCLQGMSWISRKFFLFFLNTIAGASTQSQAQAKTQSQAQAKTQSQAQAEAPAEAPDGGCSHKQKVIIYDESKPGGQVSW